MTNKFKDINSALTAAQNDLVKTYGNSPKLVTPEGKLDVVIKQLDTLTAVVQLTLKELGDILEQNSRN